MAEVDTSSYPKPAIPTSPLDIAGKLGTLEQQRVQIDTAKLIQANQAVQYLTRELATVGPNGSPEQYKQAGVNAAKQFNLPPNMLQVWNNKIDSYRKPDGSFDAPRFYDEAITTGKSHSDIMTHYIGEPQDKETQQGTKLGVRVPISPNRPVTESGAFIQRQIPPTAPVMGPGNTPILQGPQGDQPISRLGVPLPQVAPARPPASASFNDRFNGRPNPLGEPLPPGPVDPSAIPGLRAGESVNSAERLPAEVRRTGQPTGPIVGTSPDYEPGLKQFAADQDLATQKLTAIKPALQALPLARDLTTGIGTDTYNKILAAAHNLGVLPKGMTNKVAVYQELNKKLADYVRSNPVGQRSDAAQALSEAASPTAKAQINPALIKLTQDAIALDRVQAIRAMGFTDNGGNQRRDYQNYGKHRSEFPARIDERALTIDMMDAKARNKLLDEMEKKQNTFEGKKFKYTLELADKIGIFDMNR